MKRSLILLALLASLALAYERLQGPTELLFCDKAKAFNGYTLFGVGNRSFLLDMEGRVVHTWPVGTNPHLLDNGNVLDAAKDDPSGFGGFKEVDWDGKTVWEYTEKRENYKPHHDWVRIFNKKLNAPTTLYIANKSVTNEQAIAAGADPKKGPYRDGADGRRRRGGHAGQRGLGMVVLRSRGAGRRSVEAQLHRRGQDHRGLSRPDQHQPARPAAQGRLAALQFDGLQRRVGPSRDQLRARRTLRHRPRRHVRRGRSDRPASPRQPDRRAISSTASAIPPATRKAIRRECWKNWDSATSGHKQMGGAHDVQWIRPGLPGAGHIMVFNNGQYLFQRTPQSSVLEINPFLDANGRDTGKYVNPPDAGYRRETYDRDTHNLPRLISKQVVWSYQSTNNHGFFSQIGSSAQRLPNGSTFICSDTEGHFFEMTAKGELAWEYINPVTREGAVKVLADVLPMSNSAFRAYRYAADYPAFKGHDLTPKGTITERAAQGLDPQPQRRPPAQGGGGGRRNRHLSK